MHVTLLKMSPRHPIYVYIFTHHCYIVPLSLINLSSHHASPYRVTFRATLREMLDIQVYCLVCCCFNNQLLTLTLRKILGLYRSFHSSDNQLFFRFSDILKQQFTPFLATKQQCPIFLPKQWEFCSSSIRYCFLSTVSLLLCLQMFW